MHVRQIPLHGLSRHPLIRLTRSNQTSKSTLLLQVAMLQSTRPEHGEDVSLVQRGKVAPSVAAASGEVYLDPLAPVSA